MKIFTLLLVLISSFAYAQKSKTEVKPASDKPDFSCRHLEVKESENKIILRDEVKITFGNLYVEADSAEYFEKEKLVIAYSTRNFRFTGVAELEPDGNRTIRYSLKEKDVIHIER